MSAQDDFQALARDFHRAGATGLRKKLYAGLMHSAKPAVAAARKSALTNLPRGGGRGRRKSRMAATERVTIDGQEYVRRRRKVLGTLAQSESLAERVAAARFPVKMIGGRHPTIRITATAKGNKKVDLESLDDGDLRHPLFGNRKHWYAQRVPSGWFTTPMRENAKVVEKELKKAVDELVDEINKNR